MKDRKKGPMSRAKSHPKVDARTAHGGAPTGESKLRRKIVPGETERVAVWLTRGLATRLRVHAAEQRMALSVVVEEAIRAYLADGR